MSRITIRENSLLDFFDPQDDMFEILFRGIYPAWSALEKIPKIVDLIPCNSFQSQYKFSPLPERFKNAQGWCGEGTKFDDENVTIQGPVIIGANCKILSGAKIHDGCIIGHDCHIGGEVENSILFRTKAKHFSFIGHSIVIDSNVAGGVVFADLCSDEDFTQTDRTVQIHIDESRAIDSGLRKFGAIVSGSKVDACASLAPGTVISRGVLVDRNVPVYGFVKPFTRVQTPSLTVHHVPLRSAKRAHKINGGRR